MIGAELLWSFARFGARVAAFRAAAGPPLLIADHRPAPSCLPVFGPCYLFGDPNGNQLAVLGNVRPDALGAAARATRGSSR